MTWDEYYCGYYNYMSPQNTTNILKKQIKEKQKNSSLILYRTYYKGTKPDGASFINVINANDKNYPLSAALNVYWSEYALMKEIWKKGKQSDYIGFDLYSKRFSNNINTHLSDFIFRCKTTFQEGVYSQFKTYHTNKDLDAAIDILNKLYGENNEYSIYLKTGKLFYALSCFICKWEIFDLMCQFIFSVLDELDNLYNLNFDPQKYEAHYKSLFTKNYTYQRRAFGYLAERLLSAFVYVHYKDKVVINTGEVLNTYTNYYSRYY